MHHTLGHFRAASLCIMECWRLCICICTGLHTLCMHAQQTNKKKKSPGSWVQPVVPFIEQSSVSFCCQKA